MPTQTRATLKGYFTKGSIPTENNFADLIDSTLIQIDDGLLTSATAPLSIKAVGPEEGLINFYRVNPDTTTTPTWQIKQKPAGASVPGLSIGTPAATCLFIDSATGNIGVGTTAPVSSLDIFPARTDPGNHPKAVKGLYVTGDFGSASDGVEFRHSNGTQGIGFGFNSIYATGSNANQHLNLMPKGTGNVGIGTGTPAEKLDVSGNIKFNNILSTPGRMHITGEELLFLLHKQGVIIGKEWGGNGNLTVEGNVGIGTQTPGFPLTIGNNTLGDKISLWGQSGNHYGFGIQSSQLQIHTDAASADVVFGYGNSGSMTETMRIKGNGDVALLGKQALRASDTWLRLNQDGAFSSGVHTPGVLASKSLNVGGAGGWGNPGDGNVWITGNVGIGTTAPVSRLDIFQAPRTDPGNHPKAVKGLYVTGDFGSASDGVEFRHSNGSQGIGFGFNSIYATGSNANQDLNLMPKGTGRVGIGTTTPVAPLQVSGGAALGSFFLGAKVWPDQTGDDNNSNFNAASTAWGGTTHSIVSDLRIRASALDVTNIQNASDARTKRIVGRTSGEKDLLTLMEIEVTDFTFIDTATNGRAPQKKVIAQQLEKVFPQAATRATGVVPDLFQRADIRDGWIDLVTDLKAGERVRLIGEVESGVFEVLEVQPDRFRTGFRPEGEKVFVYGREVKDFGSVDYDAIAMLNVSATQELARRVEAQAANMFACSEKISTLEQRLAGIEAPVYQAVSHA